MKDINTRFGKGSLMKMGSQPDKVVDYISCGALTLDLALGGGFPKGRIVEVTSAFLPVLTPASVRSLWSHLRCSLHAFCPAHAESISRLVVAQ